MSEHPKRGHSPSSSSDEDCERNDQPADRPQKKKKDATEKPTAKKGAQGRAKKAPPATTSGTPGPERRKRTIWSSSVTATGHLDKIPEVDPASSGQGRSTGTQSNLAGDLTRPLEVVGGSAEAPVSALQYNITSATLRYLLKEVNHPPISYASEVARWMQDNWAGLVNPGPRVQAWMFDVNMPKETLNPGWGIKSLAARQNLLVAIWREAHADWQTSSATETTNCALNPRIYQLTQEISMMDPLASSSSKEGDRFAAMLREVARSIELAVNKLSQATSNVTTDLLQSSRQTTHNIISNIKGLETQAATLSTPIMATPPVPAPQLYQRPSAPPPPP